MVHYLLFGRQIVNNQSKDQWDSQEKNKKTKKLPELPKEIRAVSKSMIDWKRTKIAFKSC